MTNAIFNGFNLVNGSTNQITALASADGTRRITTLAQNMSLSGTIVTLTTTASISTQTKASTLVATIQTSLTNVNSALGQVVGRRGEVLDPGDLRPEPVRYADDRHRQSGGRQHGAGKRSLQSLQVKQQLGIQALSIANQAPQTILSLFQGG